MQVFKKQNLVLLPKNLNEKPFRDYSVTAGLSTKAVHQECTLHYDVSDRMLLDPIGLSENFPACFYKPWSSLELPAFLQGSSNAFKILCIQTTACTFS